MSSSNGSFAIIAAIISAAVTILVAWFGNRSKGVDQRYSRETTSYDQLQEDLKECRTELAAAELRLTAERGRTREEQDRADSNHRQLMLEQLGRHDMYTLFRACFGRLFENNLPYDDLNTRLDAIKASMGKA